MPPEKDHRSPAFAALERPTIAEYEAEKQRILREHGRAALLDFAKEEQFHDYLAEMGQLRPEQIGLKPHQLDRDLERTFEMGAAFEREVVRAELMTKAERLANGEGLTKAKPTEPGKHYEPER